MNRPTRSLPILLALFAIVLAPLAALAGEKEADAPKLTLVESKMVCMVNNAFMGKEQIPVEVEGKTYYGCCEMCKERLAKDEAIRYSTDPVSGTRVDKAKAVIGVLPDGAALYFENEANFNKYASKPQK